MNNFRRLLPFTTRHSLGLSGTWSASSCSSQPLLASMLHDSSIPSLYKGTESIHTISPHQHRSFASTPVPTDATHQPSDHERKMAIIYTCTKCSTRSMKTFNKSSYERGMVLVTCPGCFSRHLIADHLGWFGDKGFKIEQLGREGRAGNSVGGEYPLPSARVKRVMMEGQGLEGVSSDDIAGWSKVEELRSQLALEEQEGDTSPSKDTKELTELDLEKWRRVKAKVEKKEEKRE